MTPQIKIAEAPQNFWQFRTPSGNISCAIGSDGVLCELGEAAWASAQQTRDCEEADWDGRAVSLVADGTSVGNCATDTVKTPDAQVLAYDSGLSSGDFQCVSRRDGLTCEHLGSKRGFSVSQTKLTLF